MKKSPRQTTQKKPSKAPRPGPASITPLWQHRMIRSFCDFCGADLGDIRLGVFVGERYCCAICEGCLARGAAWIQRECRSKAYLYRVIAEQYAAVGRGLTVPTEEGLVIATAELVARGVRR
jgi:hypothetical protein